MARMVKREKRPRKKGVVWTRRLLGIFFFLLLIQAFVGVFHFVPGSSMQAALLPGDLVFVSKLHYGARTPTTPLSLPFTSGYLNAEQTTRSYSDIIRLPHYRLPGFDTLKRNDLILFNTPLEQDQPLGHRTRHISRCIGLPGDTLRIEREVVTVNADTLANSLTLQFNYVLSPAKRFEDRYFGYFDITEYQYLQDKRKYLLSTTAKNAVNLESLDEVKSVKPFRSSQPEEDSLLYGFEGNPKWTQENYGPIIVPQRGMEVELRPENLSVYKTVISTYENGEVQIMDGTIYINGAEATTYQFQRDYIFVLDENRDNASDSRHWGFVPRDHVVGKALLTLCSLDGTQPGMMDKIRWNRFLTPLF